MRAGSELGEIAAFSPHLRFVRSPCSRIIEFLTFSLAHYVAVLLEKFRGVVDLSVHTMNFQLYAIRALSEYDEVRRDFNNQSHLITKQ